MTFGIATAYEVKRQALHEDPEHAAAAETTQAPDSGSTTHDSTNSQEPSTGTAAGLSWSVVQSSTYQRVQRKCITTIQLVMDLLRQKCYKQPTRFP